jgi:Complex I intermediate-associated protein 30 (CIA30)
MFRWLRGKEGGSMRLYMKFREEMFKKNFEPLARKSSPIALYDLSRHDDAVDAANIESEKDGWRISDDGVIGGYSRGKVDIIRTSADYKRWMAGEELKDVLRKIDEEEEEGEADGQNEQIPNFIPFLRWTGNIDTTVGLTSDAQRSGFCAIRCPEYPYGGANLQGLYNALEICCRTDGRIYTVNLQVSSFIPGDMYQGYINVPATHKDKSTICPETGGAFERLVLPFNKFALTGFGRLREMQRDLDSNIEIQTVGFTLADGKDGTFQFDLASIRAVNFDGYGIQGEGREARLKIAR